MRLLIIEDNIDFLIGLADFLQKQGFTVDTAETGMLGLECLEINEYDVVLLDINLPDTIGFSLCQQLHDTAIGDPAVIMLTARDTVSDKLRGFETGADDYLVKPFDFSELVARIHALIRRKNGKSIQSLQFGDIKIIPNQYKVLIDGVDIFFPAKEYEILYFLLLKQPNPQSLEQIIEHIWDEESNPFSNSARVHIMNIRKKLKRYSTHVTIENIKKKGYYLCNK